MAIFGTDIDRCIMHRFHLESRFPTLAFHFQKDWEKYPDKVVIRIYNRSVKKYHDELVDPETFPDDLFLTKCMLIGG